MKTSKLDFLLGREKIASFTSFLLLFFLVLPAPTNFVLEQKPCETSGDVWKCYENTWKSKRRRHVGIQSSKRTFCIWTLELPPPLSLSRNTKKFYLFQDTTHRAPKCILTAKLFRIPLAALSFPETCRCACMWNHFAAAKLNIPFLLFTPTYCVLEPLILKKWEAAHVNSLDDLPVKNFMWCWRKHLSFSMYYSVTIISVWFRFC